MNWGCFASKFEARNDNKVLLNPTYFLRIQRLTLVQGKLFRLTESFQ